MVTHRWWGNKFCKRSAKAHTSVNLRSAEIKSVAGTASSARETVSSFSTLQTNKVLTGNVNAARSPVAPVPPPGKRILQRPPGVQGGPIEVPYDVEYARTDGVVAAGCDKPRLGSGRCQRLV
jgi:hypothetical protein